MISGSRKYVYIKDDVHATEVIDHLSGFNRLGYDVETTGLNIIGGEDRLLLMQLGTEEVAYLFDPRKMDPMLLQGILEDPNILKIGHNLKFDYQATRCELGIQLDNMFDTMLAYRLLNSGLVREAATGKLVANGLANKNKKQFPYKGLNYLTEHFLSISLDKSVRSSFSDRQYDREFTDKQLAYAADDVLVLHPLCDLLSQQLENEGLIDTAVLEFEFLRAVSEMEINGVCIDKEHWRKIIADCAQYKDQIASRISEILEPFQDQNTLFGTSTVNIGSKEQILDAFHNLGYEIENTEEKTLKKIDHDLANSLLEWRGYDKLISTYGEAILRRINRNTNRLHFTLLQLGTHTGRLSSEKPNIQNIPQDKDEGEVTVSFRECFRAAPGNKILTADYSQCIPVDELVCTQYGISPMGECFSSEIQVPSMNELGTTPISAYLPKGRKETIKITTVDGFTVSSTRDHRLLTDHGWVEAGNISSHHRLVLSRDWLWYNPQLKRRDALFCEMLGYWTGDGSFCSGGVQFAKGEDKYQDVYFYLDQIAQSCFKKDLKDHDGTSSWDLIGKKIKEEFRRWGCSPAKASEKEVPSLVLQSGRWGIQSYLRGLFEADGWFIGTEKNNVVAFSTRSEKLSRQVQLLLLGLGIFSKRSSYYEKTTLGGKDYSGVQYRVSICDSFNLDLFEREVGFISQIKKEILANRKVCRYRSTSDYVVLSEEAIKTLQEMAKKEANWHSIRREFFMNYYNSSQGKLRDYTRSKLHELFTRYPSIPPVIGWEHKAYSAPVKVETVGEKEVADLTVPEQHAFSVGGVFVHNCELRILAEVSQDRRFIEIFESGGDLHIITAQQVFGFSDKELEIFKKVKKEDHPDNNLLDLFGENDLSIYHKVSDFRSKTKVINFGIAYGLSAWSLAERFKISTEEAEGILNDYFSTYYGIKRWLDKNGHESIALRYSKTILGRKRYYHLADPEDEYLFRKSKNSVRRAGNNAVIQGTNADITKEALNRLQREYDNLGHSKLLFTVHDEIVSEVPEDKAEVVAKIKAEVMRQAFHRFVKTVPVGKDDEVSVTIADHWTK
ncbi:MAG: hypothetical protein GF334_02515 [Candidatus Altiarchaeales archaeon]|nr:hypothetical protein [Candidatus Altiarchaeales archaeon]